MAAAIAHIPPEVVSAALVELAGETVDPSSREGGRRSAELLQGLLGDADGSLRLVAALQRHMDGVSGPAPEFPRRYGRVVDAPRTLPHAPELDEPPVGSPEFDAFARATPEPSRLLHLEVGSANLVSLVEPSELGFREDRLEAPASGAARAFDLMFVSVERQLRAAAGRGTASVWRRLWSAIHDDSHPSLRVVTRVLAQNYVVVETAHGAAQFLTKSIASGNNIYICVISDGKVTLRERFSMDEQARTQSRLAAAFEHEGEAGAETLSQLRHAFLVDTRSMATAFRGPIA